MEQVDKLLDRELYYSIDVFDYLGNIRDIKRLANALHLHLKNFMVKLISVIILYWRY